MFRHQGSREGEGRKRRGGRGDTGHTASPSRKSLPQECWNPRNQKNPHRILTRGWGLVPTAFFRAKPESEPHTEDNGKPVVVFSGAVDITYYTPAMSALHYTLLILATAMITR